MPSSTIGQQGIVALLMAGGISGSLIPGARVVARARIVARRRVTAFIWTVVLASVPLFAACAANSAPPSATTPSPITSSPTPSGPATSSATAPSVTPGPSATAASPTPDAFVRCTLPDKPESAATTDQEQLTNCAQGDPRVAKVIAIHHWVSRNPKTPPESLRKLAEPAEYPSVRCGVAANSSSPVEVIVKLLADFRQCVATNPSAPLDLLCQLAKDEPKPNIDDPAALARTTIEQRKAGAWQTTCAAPKS